MKKILFTIMFLTLNLSLFAKQDDRLDDYSFDSSELEQVNPPYFAIAGGLTYTFHFANFDAVNLRLSSEQGGFDVDSFSGQLAMWGGEGFTGVVYVPNMRVGFFSYGGSSLLSSTFESGVKREVEYRVGLTGISLEYAIVPVKSFAVVPGISFGRGDISISTYEGPGAADWGDYKPNPGNNNYMNVASTDFWSVKPNLHLEYALTNFLMFRGSVSYNLTFGNSWKQNNIAELQNVPDDINANAFQIQAGDRKSVV